MDYQGFVAGRQALWQSFESGLAKLRRRARSTTYGEVEALAVQYRQVLHDRALAQARFAGTGAARRLQRLGLEGTYLLRCDEAGVKWSWRRLLGRALPSAMRALLPRLGVCVALFAVASGFGLISTLANPDSAALVLGPARLRQLQEGRLWTESITSAVPPSVTSSAIATNNLSVALLAWAGGAAGGLGALYVVLLNGFLLGATFGVVAHYGMAARLGEFVVAHGPLEVTIILVSAAAGLGLGKALVVASERRRSELVRAETGAALGVLGACLPWLAVLAVVESFISPLAGVSVLAKVSLGFALLALFVLVGFRPGRRLDA
ncbi:MAG TPA: stage II sporulation protein M [Thermoanaerobaculaceae bacterium]|nr:stage II sporulation protein M [Thermoanaerobaculaceae bacterium]HRS15147.1 stage II sporulation protein M [Thermoanaerobaculaceae bacterium]